MRMRDMSRFGFTDVLFPELVGQEDQQPVAAISLCLAQ
jgi:hypothetical protein